jgi:hypothetical protein
MATLTIDGKHPQLSLGNALGALRQYTGPASYVTGGDAMTAQEFKLGRLYDIIPMGHAINAGGTIRLLQYDVANAVMIWTVPNTGAEVANATDLSGYTAHLLAIGD